MKRFLSLLLIAVMAVTAASAGTFTKTTKMSSSFSSLKQPTNFPDVNKLYTIGSCSKMKFTGTAETLVYYYQDANHVDAAGKAMSWLSFGPGCSMTLTQQPYVNVTAVNIIGLDGTSTSPLTSNGEGVWNYTNETSEPLEIFSIQVTYEELCKEMEFDLTQWFPDVAEGARVDVDTATTYSVNGYFNVKYSATEGLPYFSNHNKNTTDGGEAQFVDLVTGSTITITPVKGVTLIATAPYQPAYWHTGWGSYSTFGSWIDGTDSWTYTNTSMSYKPFGKLRLYYVGEPAPETMVIPIKDIFPDATTSQQTPDVDKTYNLNGYFKMNLAGAPGDLYYLIDKSYSEDPYLSFGHDCTMNITPAKGVTIKNVRYYHLWWNMYDNPFQKEADSDVWTYTNTSWSTKPMLNLEITYTGTPEEIIDPSAPQKGDLEIAVKDLYPSITTSIPVPAGTYAINDQFSVRITGDNATYNGESGNLEIGTNTSIEILPVAGIVLTKAEYFHPMWDMWDTMELNDNGTIAFINNTSASTRFISKIRLAYDLTSTGIVDNFAGNQALPEYFDLNGRRVAQPQHGLYIKRQGNKVTKVIL